jgi:hypothetical protein
MFGPFCGDRPSLARRGESEEGFAQECRRRGSPTGNKVHVEAIEVPAPCRHGLVGEHRSPIPPIPARSCCQVGPLFCAAHPPALPPLTLHYANQRGRPVSATKRSMVAARPVAVTEAGRSRQRWNSWETVIWLVDRAMSTAMGSMTTVWPPDLARSQEWVTSTAAASTTSRSRLGLCASLRLHRRRLRSRTAAIIHRPSARC